MIVKLWDFFCLKYQLKRYRIVEPQCLVAYEPSHQKLSTKTAENEQTVHHD